MTAVERKSTQSLAGERLAAGGFRVTRQRRAVYEVLLRKRDHPTADEVFQRVRGTMPEISLATVYNCLDALVASGLARQLARDQGASRFCPNMREHGHFHCDGCGKVFDVEVPSGRALVPMPSGFRATRVEVTLHGHCPGCASGAGK